MSITNFIPTIWSETLYKELSKAFIGVNHCNRDFEGEIKGKGSVVKICGVGDITIRDYNLNSDINTPQPLDDFAITLSIDRAKYFNFAIDDINKAQTTPKLMEAALRKAADAIANETDKYVYSLTGQAGKKYINTYDSGESVFETLIKARETLYKNNVGDGTEIFLEVTPTVAAKIIREKIALPASSEHTIEKGYLGEIFGCKIYVSNNLVKTVNSSNTTASTIYHNCLLRTRRAISFVNQISEIEAYRPEKRFADAMKGLHLYGAKVVYPNEMVAVTFECLDE